MSKQAGKHGFRRLVGGHCCVLETRSVGIYEWVPAKGGGVKCSKVKVRVRGCSADWQLINASPREP